MLSKNQLKNITSLHLKKFREEKKLFIVEGEKLVDELIKSTFEITSIYAVKQWIDSFSGGLNKSLITEISDAELKKI